jgi:hypothetical protein
VSGDPLLRRVCTETLDWALAEMRGPEGGFSCALDADSEGVEGRFYVWTVAQLREALAPAGLADDAITFFGATETGNFEQQANVLEGRGPVPAARDEIRATLRAVRSQRVRPATDDKRLTSWNALMIAALAQAGAALERADYLAAAVDCASFVLGTLRDPDGRLLRTYKDGHAHIDGYLEDHAYLLEALLTLYEATFDPRWYREAVAIADAMIDRFADAERGGFFTTAADRGSGFERRKDLDDSPIPAGGSSAAFGLLRLAALSGESAYEDHARGVLDGLAAVLATHPHGFGHALQAVDFHLARVQEVVLAGGAADGVPLMQGRTPVDGRAAAYVCEQFSCRAPVTGAPELAAALD